MINYKKIQPPILILSPGRSGSTLLQRILNTSKNICIWGEHNGFMKEISLSYHKILYSKEMSDFYYSRLTSINSSLITKSYTQYEENINWLNSFEKEKTKKLYKEFIFNILNQNLKHSHNTKWGFKEIRYTASDKTVKMFIDLFPDSKFIFPIRNPFDTIASMMVAFYNAHDRDQAFLNNDIDQIKTSINMFTKRILESYRSIYQWSTDNVMNSIIIHYEDLINDKENTLKRIFQFLDEPIPPNALEPFKYRLENTGYYEFKGKLIDIIEKEKPSISEILEDYPQKLGYKDFERCC